MALDLVSPATSHSETDTVFTDLDGDESVGTEPQSPSGQDARAGHASSSKAPGLTIETHKLPPSPENPDGHDDIQPQSVIHIPSGFGSFVESADREHLSETRFPQGRQGSRPASRTSSHNTPTGSATGGKAGTPAAMSAASSESVHSVSTIREFQDAEQHPWNKTYEATLTPSPLQTAVANARDWSRTPRAQTRQEIAAAFSRPPSSLSSIQETDDFEPSDLSVDEDNLSSAAASYLREAEDDIDALRSALSECWTLCNTLANLSYIHRERMFTDSQGKRDSQEQAWKSCWRLCQNLYNTRDDTPVANVKQTLDLSRDFCQSLFDIRVRDNEAADSILRVSFELNNHLFNTHDRNLPEAFRERTLDFYITLCHRLMKQKSRMVEETESLLKACWSLAEMLFSLRQSRREGRRPDEELLGSAIQSCWELCDLFRAGWTQIRPDRSTPRASQTTFTQAFQQARRTGFGGHLDDGGSLNKMTPETPTTIFEDSGIISPDEATIPNILVLNNDLLSGRKSANSIASAPATHAHQQQQSNTARRAARTGPSPNRRAKRWSSLSPAQTFAGLSDAGRSLMSSSTLRGPSEDPHLVLLKALFVRAAVATNRGFNPISQNVTNGVNHHQQSGTLTSLPSFARSLPDTAFGIQNWQMNLLEHFKRAVTDDFVNFSDLSMPATAAGLGLDPVKGREEVALAVQGMVAGMYEWDWLRDLYRFGYGLYLEDVLNHTSTHKSRGGSESKDAHATNFVSVAGMDPGSNVSAGTGTTVGTGIDGRLASSSRSDSV